MRVVFHRAVFEFRVWCYYYLQKILGNVEKFELIVASTHKRQFQNEAVKNLRLLQKVKTWTEKEVRLITKNFRFKVANSFCWGRSRNINMTPNLANTLSF